MIRVKRTYDPAAGPDGRRTAVAAGVLADGCRIVASRRADVQSFLFLADYQALIHTRDPARVHRSTLEIAARVRVLCRRQEGIRQAAAIAAR